MHGPLALGHGQQKGAAPHLNGARANQSLPIKPPTAVPLSPVRIISYSEP
jgi:hypothetical protein